MVDLLEMIRGGPSTLGGRRNELFAGCLMGTDSAGGTLWNVGTMAVVLRTVSLALFVCSEEVVERREETEAKQNRVQTRQAGPVTND